MLFRSDYNEPVTADNLLMAANLLKNPKETWQKFKKLKEQENKQPEEEDVSLNEAGDAVVQALNSREEAGKAYGNMQETLHKMLEKMAFSGSYGGLDVRAMSTLYKQIRFMGNMAREENYEIPTEIGGSLTSINLKIIHNGQKESKVAVAFELQAFGKTAAEFKMTSKGLTGFCICSKKEGTNLLKENDGLLKEKFGREQIQTAELYFITGDSLDLAEFSLKETDKRQPGDDSGLLYRAAKAFIGFVQETGIEKGNKTYENQL